MSDEESTEPDPAPLPPYERAWRHPAEHADLRRRELEAVAAPPPLGRRIVALSSFVAATFVLAILSVAIPKGISEYTDRGDSEAIATTTSSPQFRTKNLAITNVVVVASRRGAASAVPIGGGLLLTSSDDVDGRDMVWATLATGLDVEATVAYTDPQSGFAIVRVAERHHGNLGRVLDLSTPADSVLAPIDSLGELSVVDRIGSQVIEPGSGVLTSDDSHRPIVTARAIEGVAAVIDRRGRTVAVALRHAHATWLVPRATLADILSEAVDF